MHGSWLLGYGSVRNEVSKAKLPLVKTHSSMRGMIESVTISEKDACLFESRHSPCRLKGVFVELAVNVGGCIYIVQLHHTERGMPRHWVCISALRCDGE